MKYLALKTLLLNAEPISHSLEMTAPDLVRNWLGNPVAVSGLLSEYREDYYLMLYDFGENDKDVINYKAVIGYLESISNN